MRYIILFCLSFGLYAADVEFSWEPPTKYTDGSPLFSVDSYKIYYTLNDSTSVIEVPGLITTHIAKGLDLGRYVAQMTAIKNGAESSRTNPFTFELRKKRNAPSTFNVNGVILRCPEPCEIELIK